MTYKHITALQTIAHQLDRIDTCLDKHDELDNLAINEILQAFDEFIFYLEEIPTYYKGGNLYQVRQEIMHTVRAAKLIYRRMEDEYGVDEDETDTIKEEVRDLHIHFNIVDNLLGGNYS